MCELLSAWEETEVRRIARRVFWRFYRVYMGIVSIQEHSRGIENGIEGASHERKRVRSESRVFWRRSFEWNESSNLDCNLTSKSFIAHLRES